MKEIAVYPGCFVCGQKNHVGLKARFFWDGGKAVCDVTVDERYVGYKGILHGGVVATLLDEVMIKALLAEEIFAVTAEISVRFKKPVNVGDVLHFEGWKAGHKGSVYSTSGRAANQNGAIVAEAEGKYIRPRGKLSDRLRESLE